MVYLDQFYPSQSNALKQHVDRKSHLLQCWVCSQEQRLSRFLSCLLSPFRPLLPIYPDFFFHGVALFPSPENWHSLFIYTCIVYYLKYSHFTTQLKCLPTLTSPTISCLCLNTSCSVALALYIDSARKSNWLLVQALSNKPVSNYSWTQTLCYNHFDLWFVSKKT